MSNNSVADEALGAPPAFRLFYDEQLSVPTPYGGGGSYFKKAKDRMDRSFALVQDKVRGGAVVDLGASPFYLLFRAQAAGAKSCLGVYFANDDHPLRHSTAIYSGYGAIDLSHANIETDVLPLAADSIDVLTACEILEHCEYFPERIASEIVRVVRPGGTVCITVPNVASIANILKLVGQKNIYMKYRSDTTGRHKHEYTKNQLKALVEYLGLDLVKIGFLPSPTSDKFWLRPFYRILAHLPVFKSYSPVLYVVARQSVPKRGRAAAAPTALFDSALSIED